MSFVADEVDSIKIGSSVLITRGHLTQPVEICRVSYYWYEQIMGRKTKKPKQVVRTREDTEMVCLDAYCRMEFDSFSEDTLKVQVTVDGVVVLCTDLNSFLVPAALLPPTLPSWLVKSTRIIQLKAVEEKR